MIIDRDCCQTNRSPCDCTIHKTRRDHSISQYIHTCRRHDDDRAFAAFSTKNLRHLYCTANCANKLQIHSKTAFWLTHFSSQERPKWMHTRDGRKVLLIQCIQQIFYHNRSSSFEYLFNNRWTILVLGLLPVPPSSSSAVAVVVGSLVCIQYLG